MLKTLTDKEKTNWTDSLNKLIFAYNCTRTEVTGFSPFYLLYGRSPRLPIDTMFSLPTETGNGSHHVYVEKWKQGMQEAYAIATENAHKSAQRNKRLYDTKVRTSVLHPGDRVLVRNMTPRGGTGKLRNHWEDTIHTIVRQVGDRIPVYELGPEHGKGKSRIMHRNHLLPCDYLPVNVERQDPSKLQKKANSSEDAREDSEDEDDDDGYYLMDIPVNLPSEPTASGKDTNVIVHDATASVPSESEAEQPQLEVNTGHQLDAQDGDNPPDVEEEIPLFLVNQDHEYEMEMRPQRPQRQRRPPRTLRYDKIGTPSCYSLAAVNGYGNYPYWIPSIQSYNQQHLYLYGV